MKSEIPEMPCLKHFRDSLRRDGRLWVSGTSPSFLFFIILKMPLLLVLVIQKIQVLLARYRDESSVNSKLSACRHTGCFTEVQIQLFALRSPLYKQTMIFSKARFQNNYPYASLLCNLSLYRGVRPRVRRASFTDSRLSAFL